MSFGKRFLIFAFWSFLGLATIQLIFVVMAIFSNSLRNMTLLAPQSYFSPFLMLLRTSFKFLNLIPNQTLQALVIFSVICSLMSLISYKKALREAVLGLIIVCSAISSVLLFILTFGECGAGGDFACGVVWGLLMLIASTFWILAAGFMPLSKFSSEKKNVPFFSKKRLSFGFKILLFIFVVGTASTSNLMRHGYSNSSKQTQSLNQIYADKSFATFQPTYLPSIIDKNSRRESGVIAEKEKAYFLNYSSSKEIVERKSEYTTQKYKYKADLGITQGNRQNNLSDEQRFQTAFNYQYDLIVKNENDNGPYNYYKGNKIEKLTINNYPGYYYFDNNIGKAGELWLYREGTDVRIQSTNYNFTKEELIKIAESLKKN